VWCSTWSSSAEGRELFRTPDRRLLLLSIVLQVALAVAFGHSYDSRVFMAAGYLVGHGQDPYIARDLSAVFHHPLFDVMTTVGYPPPWPLVLGLLWRLTALVTPAFLVYGLVIKLPVIAATVGLAYLVAAALEHSGARPAAARAAWIALLFNPLVLFAGAAWGQIDVIVALLSVGALALLCAGRWASSALLLSLAVCTKPIGWPILLVALAFLVTRSPRRAAGYAVIVAAASALLLVAPFVLLRWDATPILRHPNAHFLMSGALSFMTVIRLFREPLLLPGHWWLVSLLWIPAVGVAAILLLRHGVADFGDLAARSAALVLVFLLTRTWVAEPNAVLLVPLVLIPVALGRLDRRLFTAVWAVPLAFAVFDLAPLQLLWAAFPGAMARALRFAGRYRDATLAVRACLAVVWQVLGWWLVVACGRRRSGATRS
jgi:hypothetical protein